MASGRLFHIAEKALAGWPSAAAPTVAVRALTSLLNGCEGSAVPPGIELRARLMLARTLQRYSTDLKLTERHAQSARTLAKQLGDRIATLEALELLAELLQGDQLANAKTILREALSEAFAIKNPEWILRLSVRLAHVLQTATQYADCDEVIFTALNDHGIKSDAVAHAILLCTHLEIVATRFPTEHDTVTELVTELNTVFQDEHAQQSGVFVQYCIVASLAMLHLHRVREAKEFVDRIPAAWLSPESTAQLQSGLVQNTPPHLLPLIVSVPSLVPSLSALIRGISLLLINSDEALKQILSSATWARRAARQVAASDQLKILFHIQYVCSKLACCIHVSKYNLEEAHHAIIDCLNFYQLAGLTKEQWIIDRQVLSALLEQRLDSSIDALHRWIWVANKAQKDPIGLFAALHLRQLLVARFYSAAGRKMIKEDLVNQASEIVATLTDLLVSLDDHHLLRAATVLDSIDCFRQESRLESRTRLLEYFDKKNAAEIDPYTDAVALFAHMIFAELYNSEQVDFSKQLLSKLLALAEANFAHSIAANVAHRLTNIARRANQVDQTHRYLSKSTEHAAKLAELNARKKKFISSHDTPPLPKF